MLPARLSAPSPTHPIRHPTHTHTPLLQSGTPRCVKVARPEPVDPCIFTTCLVGTFCQADGDTANCITNCATVRCAAGTRCETDPDTGNASCVPDV